MGPTREGEYLIRKLTKHSQKSVEKQEMNGEDEYLQ